MSWTKDNQQNAWSHTGTGRDVVIAGKPDTVPFTPDTMISGQGAYTIVAERVKHQIRHVIRSSEDGRYCIEVGVYDGAFLNAIDGGTTGTGTGTHRAAAKLYGAVLRVELVTGTASTDYSILHESDDDLVTDGLISTINDQNVVQETRLVDNTVMLRIGGSDAFSTAYEFDDDLSNGEDDYPTHSYYGFASDVANAVAKNPQVCSLDPVFQEASDLMCIVSNGALFLSVDGEKPYKIGPIAHGGDTEVDGVEFEGKLYVVDGQWGRVFDYADESITPWGPSSGNDYWDVNTDGQLPGASDHPGAGGGGIPAGAKQVGTTTAKFIEVHNNRVWLAGMPEDPREYYGSKVGDAGKWNTGEDAIGRAFQGSNEATAGIPSSPITGLWSYQDDYILFGGQTDMHIMRGDPVFDDARVMRVTRQAGIIGKDAVFIGDDGSAWVMTEQGLAVLAGDQLRFISKDVLTTYIAKGKTWPKYRTHVVRDSDRYGVLIIFDRIDKSENPIHLWFDERTVGFFPESYDTTMRASATARINDQVHIGTTQGFVYIFDDARKSDLRDAANNKHIHSFAPIGLIMDTDGFHATRVRRLVVSLARGSDNLDLYYSAGMTPEDAYTSPRQVLSKRVAAPRIEFRDRVTDGAIVISLDSPRTDKQSAWGIESLEVVSEPAGMLREALDFTGTGTGGTGTGTGGTGTGSGFGDPGGGTGSGTGDDGPTGFTGSGFTGSGTGGDPTGTGLTGTGTGTGLTGTGTGTTGTGTGTGDPFDNSGSGIPNIGDSLTMP